MPEPASPTKTIGLAVLDHVSAGLVRLDEGHSGEIASEIVRVPPPDEGAYDILRGMPVEDVVALMADRAADLVKAQPPGSPKIVSAGVAFPGLIQGGIVEEAPNLPQFKGCLLEVALADALAQRGIPCSVRVANDADAVAAGIAARHGQLDRRVRVWTLGNGIGYGRYPLVAGSGEGGHMVVSLDPNEKFCGCGGRGHLEGIAGARAMRLRFLDMEPEEVFAAALNGDDPRCSEFMLLWHRAIAAATASSIHVSGPGKFYFSGPNARFVNITLLNRYVQEMVMMSTLQGYTFEVIPQNDEHAVVGAAVIAGT